MEVRDTSRSWLLSLSVLLPVCIVLWLGQDSTHDQRNYHIYNGYALLHHRLGIDVSPANLQTYHNPFIHVPIAWLNEVGVHGIWIVQLLTVPTMVGLYFLLRMFVEQSPKAPHPPHVVALAIMAVSGAAALSTMGTSMIDSITGCGIIPALYLALREPERPEAFRDWGLAGLIAGFTTALKLTAAVYCLGLAAASLCIPGRRVHRLAALFVGGVLGFAPLGATWSLYLYWEYGNPTFPYQNHIFLSPFAPQVAIADLRFVPKTWTDFVLSPLRLCKTNTLFSELPLRDPRLFLGVLLLGFNVLYRWKEKSAHASRMRALAAFLGVSFFLWGKLFGVYRYTIPLELLSAFVLVQSCLWFPWSSGRAAVVAALALWAFTISPEWGRVPFSRPYVRVSRVDLPERSKVLSATSDPFAFVATGLPDDVPLLSPLGANLHPIFFCTKMHERLGAILDREGPAWILRSKNDDPSAETFVRDVYGWVATSDCLSMDTYDGPFSLCRAEQVAPKRPCP